LSRLLTAALVLAVAALTTLLFVGGPAGDWPRSLRHGWDLGHVGLFALAALLALRGGLERWPLPKQAAALLSGTLALGIATEWLQRGSSRSASLGDLGRDLLGAVLALAFASPAVGALPRWRRNLVRAAVLAALAWQVAPVLCAAADEFAAWRDFPLLAGFEEPFEVERWSGSAAFGRTTAPQRDGERALRVEFGTGTYSGVTLAHFPGNWSGYQALTFQVFNPEPESLELHCKVHDREHRRRGRSFADRFNRKLTVAPGWNDFRLPLEEIRAAPRDRAMDLSQVVVLQFFTVRLPRPRTLYLDAVRLL